jgi:hypothetical protein
MICVINENVVLVKTAVSKKIDGGDDGSPAVWRCRISL